MSLSKVALQAGVAKRTWKPIFLPAVLLLFGGAGYLRAGAIRFMEREGQIGPDFWPRAIFLLLIVTAGAQGLTALRKGAGKAKQAGEAPAQGSVPLCLLGSAMLAGYVVASLITGFLLSTTLFMTLFLYFARYRHWSVPVISLISTVLITYLFVGVIYISLPVGFGPFGQLSTILYSILGIY